ncbi:MAG: hypothetical protein DI530_16170 [Sphingomonas sp.]|uniref:AbiU2 domain-containing protein n=1 Tax=Sphingomonas sp. TaxID=28214 RepID=UPI000DBBEDE6|nr:hypothetical protein [Sphingomonas sp.]PZU74426.1 MAG: hypothetical protein DI530_16170 [Sphingomonas sp.]
MRDLIQANYEERLSRYATLLHGTEPPGLAAKLGVYAQLLRQREIHGDRLWKIEPMLYPLMLSAETDLHLATARLLEDPRRAEGSVFAFLNFCRTNRENILWKAGTPPAEVIEAQVAALESHRPTINAIMGRRDRFFAHLDKKYFLRPGQVYDDYPLEGAAVIALVNAVIKVISEHQWSLKESANFHVAGFFEIGVENMVRNLEAGRRQNYPGQLD